MFVFNAKNVFRGNGSAWIFEDIFLSFKQHIGFCGIFKIKKFALSSSFRV